MFPAVFRKCSYSIHLRNPVECKAANSNRAAYTGCIFFLRHGPCIDKVHRLAGSRILGRSRRHLLGHSCIPRKSGNCKSLLCTGYTWHRRNSPGTGIHPLRRRTNRLNRGCRSCRLNDWDTINFEIYFFLYHNN